jgi:uncharacterized protein (TIGR03435 family)
MNNDKSKDRIDLLGEFLRDRTPLDEEEQGALDRVWQRLPKQTTVRSRQVSQVTQFPKEIWGIAVASAALLLIIVWSGRDRNVAPASVDNIGGALTRIVEKGSLAVRSGEKLGFGELLHSGSGSGSMLVMTDGSKIEMRPNSELTFEKASDGVRIRLNGGSVLITAAKQRKGHLYVQTKDVAVSVVGTVFLVNAEEAGSGVSVFEGEVRVQQGKELKKLLPGDQLSTNPLMPVHPVADQIAWARKPEESLALLPQAAAPKRLAFDAASIRPGRPIQEQIPTRLRCRGIDGEFDVLPASAPAGPAQGRCTGDNVILVELVSTAYGIPLNRISGLPNPETQPTYSINAVAEDPSRATKAELRQMLQTLLMDRFNVRVHRETKEVDGWVLTVGKSGVKFKETSGDEEPAGMRPAPGALTAGGDRGAGGMGSLPSMIKGKIRMNRFAQTLSAIGQAPVLERTDLAGLYDITFMIDVILPPPGEGGGRRGGGGAVREPEFSPPLPKALEDQLGLHLERAKVPLESLVVDHIEKATDN